MNLEYEGQGSKGRRGEEGAPAERQKHTEYSEPLLFRHSQNRTVLKPSNSPGGWSDDAAALPLAAQQASRSNPFLTRPPGLEEERQGDLVSPACSGRQQTP